MIKHSSSDCDKRLQSRLDADVWFCFLHLEFFFFFFLQRVCQWIMWACVIVQPLYIIHTHTHTDLTKKTLHLQFQTLLDTQVECVKQHHVALTHELSVDLFIYFYLKKLLSVLTFFTIHFFLSISLSASFSLVALISSPGVMMTHLFMNLDGLAGRSSALPSPSNPFGMDAHFKQRHAHAHAYTRTRTHTCTRTCTHARSISSIMYLFADLLIIFCAPWSCRMASFHWQWVTHVAGMRPEADGGACRTSTRI